MGNEAIEKLGYSLLKDVEFVLTQNENFFTFCFWVYLPTSTPFPSTILYQMHTEKPCLSLNEEKRLIFSPSIIMDKEISDSGVVLSSKEVPCAISNVELSLGRWTHIGCEVRNDIICIYLDGNVVGESSLNSSMVKVAFQSSERVNAIYKGFSGLDGYVYNAIVLPSTASIKDHHVKDPPVWLCVDSSSTSNIEFEGDGIWKVGGKESCRKIFSLDVLLLDAFGELVDKELEVVASLTYAENHTPIEKTKDGEAPLLVTCNGCEFPSHDKPFKLLQGRASFQLNISQRSSESGNKLFSVKFDVLNLGSAPFLEAFTPAIRCISRTIDNTKSTITWKKLSSGVHLFSGFRLPQFGVGNSEVHEKVVCEAIPSPPSKRKKLIQDTPVQVHKPDSFVQAPVQECISYTQSETKVQDAVRTSLESIQENYGGMGNSSPESESVGVRTSEMKTIPRVRELNSDMTVFRYCLGDLSERALILKDISMYASEKEMEEIADKVSLFSGCSHHRYQIMMSKRLLEEGERAWNSISRNSHRVHWDNAVFEIEEQFMRIANCSTRSLTQQDLNFLRRSSGGHDYIVKDDFDKMWNWLYPVAYTISRQGINAMWACITPKWIEGFVTKEEVQHALQSPSGIQEPGTFILRFPTTRSWPHPDAGSLVVSYVSKDFSLRHRQLSLDYSCDIFDTNQKPLEELILSEPELSRVGRIARNDMTI